MKCGTVEPTITDDTLPDGPRKRTIIYEAPFDRCNREMRERLNRKIIFRVLCGAKRSAEQVFRVLCSCSEISTVTNNEVK